MAVPKKNPPLQVVAPAFPYLVPQGMKNVLQVPRLEQCPVGNEGSIVGSKASRCRKTMYFPPKEGRDRRGEWEKIGTISR